MSLVPRCTVCDEKLDAYGRDGTRCDRCKEPCPTCNGDVRFCTHPLTGWAKAEAAAERFAA